MSVFPVKRRTFPDHREHHAPLVNHVQGSVRSSGDAEDIVQEAWLRAMARMEAEEQGLIRNLRAFLYRIAGNLSIDHLRRRKVLLLSRVEGRSYPRIAEGPAQIEQKERKPREEDRPDLPQILFPTALIPTQPS